MAKKLPIEPAKIEAVRHKDTRKNIPTEELRDFVKEEEQKPKTILYPRDPSLDPQLVWKGKDEQDQKPLEVPAVPIYIQEKIHPQAIIEDFRATQRRSDEATKGQQQLGLFSDFNGLPKDFADKVDFYHHDGHWSNRMILGDSLMVMTSLAEKEGLKGRVQTIYFDPPYGIKFGSNWQVSTRKRDVKDGKLEDMTRQPEQIKAFRDTYVLGIHSYLPYLRDRLVVARDLLTESGSIFVQISDENVHLVRCLLDEIFGRDNFVSEIIFRKKSMPLGSDTIETMTDFLLWYAKDRNKVKVRQIYKALEVAGDSHWSWLELSDGRRRKMSLAEREGDEVVSDKGRKFQLISLYPPSFSASAVFPVTVSGEEFLPRNGACWITGPEGFKRLDAAHRLMKEGAVLRYVLYETDYPWTKLTSVWMDTQGAPNKVYAVQTDQKVIARAILMTTDPGDLVLDPTCGGGTTAYVAEQWGRRWITIDTSRVALALARTRLMCGRFPYYLLADSPEGRKKQKEVDPQINTDLHRSEKTRSSKSEICENLCESVDRSSSSDVRRGFVYQRVPHVTLKSIANNPDIKEGMTRTQIEAAIARHTETETLYDKPYEDSKRLRVTGPFTVESLSPHRTISVEAKKQAAEKPAAEGFTIKMLAGGSFTNMILENLKKAGVQNTSKAERLKFDSLEPYPGEWIAGDGKYTEKDGKPRRAAICIGPEYGTVGPELIKQSAKEAVRGVGFDVLIVCGFAFDPHVTEEAKRYGNLTVLICRMNPDLSMGDDLLKKTGAGNLFMVFGEPDIVVKKLKVESGKQKEGDGEQVVVEIRGLDVYDPTTGEIRSNTTDEIACWFVDTNYDGESFFVRHAYFTGADEPYEKLKKALRAEIDEGAWSQLYSTTSRAFETPATGKIAIKVINHYGDEVMKVYEVK